MHERRDCGSGHWGRNDPGQFFAELDVARSDYLVQPRLVRCDELRDVMPGTALGTLRIITYIRRDGTVLAPYAIIKLPVTGQVADNFVHGQSGNLISGIDVASGTMINAFGRPRGKHLPTQFRTHPETGSLIVGRRVPRWHDVLDLSVRAAKAFREMRTVGWDIGITDEGPIVIEGNRTYDADLLQITLQRGLRSEIDQLFDS